MTPSDITRLRDRLQQQHLQSPERILPVIASEIMEHHHRATALEIAKLLLEAVGVEATP